MFLSFCCQRLAHHHLLLNENVNVEIYIFIISVSKANAKRANCNINICVLQKIIQNLLFANFSIFDIAIYELENLMMTSFIENFLY